MIFFSRLLLLALILQCSSCSFAESPKIATWNLQNYLIQNRFENGVFRFDYPLPEYRKSEIRSLILRERPDVLFLQEIGSQAFLNELVLDLRALGLEYAFSAFSGVDNASRGLAYLSRNPPKAFLFHHPVKIKADYPHMRRGVQEVCFEWQGASLTFLHVHLKSRYSDDPLDPQSRNFRKAELAALQGLADLIRSGKPDTIVALVGDFNTPFGSDLFDGLRHNWRPLDANDDSGEAWTYTHQKSGASDRIDGFWVPANFPPDFNAHIPATTSATPSDHRMVLLELK